MKNMTQRIGFSTGSFETTGLPLNERIVFLRDLGCKAIELGYVRNERVMEEPIADIDISLLRGFLWVSFHAPGSRWTYTDDPETTKLLSDIEALHRKRPLDLVIFHPDSLRDLSLFDHSSFPIGIENMDESKASFQDVETLHPVFAAHPNWGFVLDTHHVFRVDPSLNRVKEFLHAFGNRLREIHVSGYRGGHVPLHETKQDMMLDVIRGVSVPVIIESKTSDLKAIEREYAYVRNRLFSYVA